MKITELFQNREFVVSAEVGPPKGIHIDGMVEEAKKYLTGVHFVNVTDNQSSVMRLGSLATCKVLKDAGLNPIFQLTCRDRNRIALQSDLLSAAMLGIDNILCLTGDHTKLGDHPQAKPVFDLDSVSLLYAASMLETGKDLGGNELVGEAPKFAKGAVVSPCSDSVDAQLVKMERKVKAGAEYFQTQAVFEPEKFIKFMESAKQFGKPVIAFQNSQFKVAEMQTKIDAARLMTWRAAVAEDNHETFGPLAAMAKLFAAEAASDVTRRAVQLFGGYGYTRDYPVERMMRDAKITEIYEGTSEVQRMVIAANLKVN